MYREDCYQQRKWPWILRRKYYWNPQGELAFTVSTENTSESEVHEGDLVTTPYLRTRTDIYIKVGGA